jgi:WD40 repeat protein
MTDAVSIASCPKLFMRNTISLPQNGQYVIGIAPTIDYTTFTVNTHKNIYIYDTNTLQPLQELIGHRDTITEAKYINQNTLLTSSKDKTINIWDVRASQQPAKSINLPSAVLSFDVNSTQTVLAAGTELIGEDAIIYLWDVNGDKLCAQFPDSHSDDITQVRFQPNTDCKMVTGSTDGLISLFDITSLNEDDSLQFVITADSINTLGYFGPEYEYLYSLTHVETFSMYTSDEGDVVNEFGDIRQLLAHPELPIQYIIDCHYDNINQRLYLIAGVENGDIGVFHVGATTIQLCGLMKGGHSDIVRACTWNHEHNFIITGGEDSKMCIWTE